MNPITKRRLPSSLRSLLKDIGPKEEWTDLPPDAEIRDGIVLPLTAAASAPGELLAPSHDQTTVESNDEWKSRAVCLLCNCKPSLYTCPRCHVPYCSLSCYKSPEHSVCSEEFYKESVLQELKHMGKTEAEGQKKMQEILLGLRKKAVNTDGGIEGLLKEEGIMESKHESEESKINVETIELLSRLAELQEADEENTEEIENILRLLQKIGTGENIDAVNNEDAQDENDGIDLAERLQGLDIDELSEEQLWDLLNKEEKNKFVGLIKRGAFNGFVTVWQPWWEEHEESGQVLIEVLQDEMSKETKCNLSSVKTVQKHTQENESDTKIKQVKVKRKDRDKSQSSGVPPVSAKIPKLSCLCSNPSPLIGYSLINTMFSYAFTLCFFNGDTDSLIFELCDMILALSEALDSNKIFNSVQEALVSGESLILGEGYLSKDDPNAPARAVEAVAHILTGRNREDSTGYCLSALSQLRAVLSKARATISKEGDGGNKRKKYFMVSKKCEFLQAWVVENQQNVTFLAIELWNEHQKRQCDFFSMSKAKTEVEESLKKGKQRGNVKLVEEM